MAKKASSPKTKNPAAKKAAAKKKSSKAGIRYTDEEKAEIIQFVQEYGRGGQTAASKKFGVSQLTISNWLKKARGTAPKKKATRKAVKVQAAAPSSSAAILERMMAIQAELESLQAEFDGLKSRL